jgi:hypothetical protein
MMKLKTSLQLSAIFPIVFAIAVTLSLTLRFSSGTDWGRIDTAFVAFMGVLGLSMAAIILSYSRDVLRKINTLNEWVDTVLKGNLIVAGSQQDAC